MKKAEGHNHGKGKHCKLQTRNSDLEPTRHVQMSDVKQNQKGNRIGTERKTVLYVTANYFENVTHKLQKIVVIALDHLRKSTVQNLRNTGLVMEQCDWLVLIVP